jgi:hypothetical protein
MSSATVSHLSVHYHMLRIISVHANSGIAKSGCFSPLFRRWGKKGG